MKAVETVRSNLSKIKFAMGFNPRVIKEAPSQDFIPEGYSSVLTITADFELAWAPRYTNSSRDPYSKAVRLATRERRNIPILLQHCESYNIPITWATVGHLFLQSCEPHQGVKHPEIASVPHYNGKYWSYKGDDWFEFDPCTSLEEDPLWYAPDLVDSILSSRVNHEIGCHTFSHIDCREEVCPPELFQSELIRCKELAAQRSISLKSFVHPGHTIGHLALLEDLGFTSYQTDPGNILGYPIKHFSKLWELQRTMALDLRSQWSLKYHIDRFKKIVDRSMDHGLVCNFWFHPSVHSSIVDEVFPQLLEHIDQRRSHIWIGRMSDYVHFLNDSE